MIIDSTSSTNIIPTTDNDVYLNNDNSDVNEVCTPFTPTNSVFSACEYVKFNSDSCEGGGYLMWTQYILCAESEELKIFLIIIAIICMLILFIAMSTAADDFFCPSISGIVNHLKISQSVAGITFMAFGNGAPDIFSTIASVLNTKHPKANLALGDLLGGGCFVTTIVFATVIIAKPFNAARRPTFRDIFFYLISIGWMAFIMIYDSKLHIWQPAAYLALYLLYVSTVIFGRLYHKLERKKARYLRKLQAANHSRPSELRVDELSLSSHQSDKNINRLQLPRLSLSSLYNSTPEKTDSLTDENDMQFEGNISPSNMSKFSFNSPLPVMMEPMPDVENNSNYVIPNIVISSADSIDGHIEMFKYCNGAFKYEEKEADTDSTDSDPGMVVVVPPSHGHTGRRYTIMSLTDARSRKASSIAVDQLSIFLPNKRPTNIKTFLKDFLKALNLIDEDFQKFSIISKIFQIIKIPVLFLLRITIPQSEIWFKPLIIIQALIMPQIVLIAFSQLSTKPITNGPGLWVYVIPISIIMALIIFFKSSYIHEPRYYKNIASYFGFLMSVCWIYAISTEIVNIILMLSVISKLSHEILGLTIMAWSNSIGDLIADISVARQGFPQMAASAAIGGPLFNLLIGFGIPFFIAMVTGKKVELKINGVTALMLILLAISLISTQLFFVVNKFSAKKIQAYFLIGLYIIFICLLILTELDIIPIDKYIGT